MAKSRPSLAYHDLENESINEFATGVKLGMKNHPVEFPSPPFTELEYDAKISDFSIKLNAWQGGGSDQRGPFLDSKAVLMEAMDDTAEYVDEQANGNETIIVAGGFTPTKITRTPKPEPEIPTGVKATAKGNGKIDTECDKMKNAEFYGAVLSTSSASLNNIFANGQFNFSNIGSLFILVDCNKDRVKTFTGLTGGTNYYVQFYCGNSKGTTLLSEPVRVMATI